MNTASQKSDTFFGGRSFSVTYEDGATEEIKIRQLKLAEYIPALPLLEDEIALAAFCCQRWTGSAGTSPLGPPCKKDWLTGAAPDYANAVRPESYEELQKQVREVNEKGFFSFAARRQESERRQKEELIRSMSALPPETLKTVGELASASRRSSPSPRPISG
jgi:hypothetical protein